jgi:hypothetical protein
MENKTSKYFKYAIGEIVLVVIGILIALQINNWNENRKGFEEEQNYLKALKEEFKYNQEVLNQTIARNTKNIEGTGVLIELIEPNSPGIDPTEMEKLFSNSIHNEVQYRPSPGVLLEIINAGKLGNFSDTTLKKELASWESELERVKFQEDDEVQLRRMLIVDFLRENTNARKRSFTVFGKIIGYKDSKFKPSNINILQIEEFENLMVNFVVVSHILNKYYYPRLNTKIDRILNLIDANIE